MNNLARGLCLALLVSASAGCASNPPPASASPAKRPAAAETADLESNIRQFGDEVRELNRSAQNPSSVEDPASFRGRLRAGEQRLSQRAAGLRERIHAAFGTKPVPIGAANQPEKPSQREQEMLDRLDESEKQLGATREKL